MRIEVKNVSKSYGGFPVLQNLDLTLETGVSCLMAPSGTGKTTLLRLLLGFEQPDGGVISGLKEARMSAVFQEDRLLEHLSAKENLRFVLGGAYDEQSVSEILSELGLSDTGEKAVRDFSGGMRRRLALARALIVPFDFLALDEPFTGLDYENHMRAIACIRTRTEGKTVLLITHDRNDVKELHARIISLQI